MNLVTGATGLLGSHIAEQLCKRGQAVRALVRPDARTSFLDSLGVEKVVGDLSDAESLHRACQGCQFVYHSAAMVGDWGPWSDFQKITIDGTRYLLDASIQAGVKRFLHVSSISAYGYVDGKDLVLDESAPLGQNLYRWSYYSRAKVRAEELVWDAYRKKGLPITIIRPSWLYGPRDRASTARLVGAIRKGRAKLIGDGNNRLSLAHAGNVAEAAILAASKDQAIGQAYNCNSDGIITQGQYLNLIAETLGYKPVTKKVPYWLAKKVGFLLEVIGRVTGRKEPPMISRYAVWLIGRQVFFDTGKIRALGWQPTTDYKTGVPDAIKWHLQQAEGSKTPAAVG